MADDNPLWILGPLVVGSFLVKVGLRGRIAFHDGGEKTLIELNPREEFVKKCVKTFGTTDDPRYAGYIMHDGKMLDFSGKQFGAGPTKWRTLEHSEIVRCIDTTGYGRFPFMALIDFFQYQTNAIRVLGEFNTLHFSILSSQEPTSTQLRQLRRMAGDTPQIFYEITHPDGSNCECGTVINLSEFRRVFNKCKEEYEKKHKGETFTWEKELEG